MAESNNGLMMVKSKKDLLGYGEAFHTENGERKLKYTYFYYVDGSNVAYFGHTQTSKFELTGELLQECLEPIPDEDIYPESPATVTVFSKSITTEYYLKRPDLSSWDDFAGKPYLSQLFLAEVEALELLQKHAHPNIVPYHDCIISRGCIVGLVLSRFSRRLKEVIEDRTCTFDSASTFRSIASTIEYLHGLGLAHNDLNPYNIMLDENTNPVLIDFASCKPFGAVLQEGGTPGWVAENRTFRSKIENDDIALQKIEIWMHEHR